ncbi:hypothetical protein [Cupriavidus numazuensis]|uniref:Uncharacterized protein n=1 Tax=Cupriavidus numazuensis TaxID=221992 RepID=A0ABN7PR50_9BURK|nr:hypothetical protein [Cupriavidus numazuensis]CAG2132365.1 hypothetical protein LMG26411_00605 [Cupriavidus numazuensis]
MDCKQTAPAAEPVVVVTGGERARRASLQIAQALGMAIAMAPRGVNYFAALEPRTLTSEETREAFKPGAEDLRRKAAAEAKRARRAAKLRSL